MESDPDQPVIVIAASLLEYLGLDLGDYLGLVRGEQIRTRARDVGFYKIVGAFAATDLDIQLITPLVHLNNHLGDLLMLERAEFALNPQLNRELAIFRQEIAQIMGETDTRIFIFPDIITREEVIIPQLFFFLNDHTLQEVVVPLEQTITMMETLYPIILGLSGLIAVGLTALLLLPLTKEVATMRALGATRRHVMIMLILEQKVLCLLGLGMGALIAIFAYGWANLFDAVLYLLGCLVAAIIFSVILVNRKPLELLQVKE